MRHLRRLFAVAVVVVVGFSLADPAGADPVSDESDFVARINTLRTSKGLQPLRVDPSLTTVARGWAARMASANDISHNMSLGQQVPSNWTELGENVGVGPDVAKLWDAFVASPGHYTNLVDPKFDLVGVGIVYANGSLWVAQEFMRVSAPVATVSTSAGPVVQGATAKQTVAKKSTPKKRRTKARRR